MPELNKYPVSKIKWHTDDLVQIFFHGFDQSFVAGEHVTLSTLNNYEAREYSIYSGENEKGISLLIKIVEDGYFTPKLRELKEKEELLIGKPHGAFSFNADAKGKHWFISTGTGVAPMNSMIKTHSVKNYHLVHGVRKFVDASPSAHFPREKLEVCVSREKSVSKFKHVTEFISSQRFKNEDCFYLCGNGSMVYDCKNLLRDMDISPEKIFTEVYF